MSLNRVIETGSYTGNGSSQTISIGWQPAFVWVTSTRTAGGPNQRGQSWKLPSLTSDNSIRIQSTALLTTGCITITSTGFSVGSDNSVNRNGTAFHYIAIRDRSHLDHGSFTGADPTGTTLTLNRQPAWLVHLDDTDEYAAIKHPDWGTDTFWEFDTSGKTATGLTINSDGFTAAGGTANASGSGYHWSAFYETTGSTRNFEMATYTGDGNASQTITLGRQPKILYIMAGDTNYLITKTDTMAGSDVASATSTAVWLPSGGISLTATGFTAATSYNASGVTYRYIAGYR